MKRIDHPSAITNSEGKKVFTPGDPQLGRPPTALTADWANMLQEELAHLLELNGVQLDASDSRQLFKLLRRQERPPIGIGDFRPLPGAPSAGSVVFLDFIESPVGVVCVHENCGSVYLARGGQAEVVTGYGDDFKWASIVVDGNQAFVCGLDGTTTTVVTHSMSVVPAHFQLEGGGAMQDWSYAGRFVQVGVDSPIWANVDPRYEAEFVAGRLLDPEHLLVIRRVRYLESGLDELQAVVRWVAADVLFEHTFFSHPLPFTAWPYEFAPGVDPRTRSAIALRTGATYPEFACVVGDNDSTKLVRGRILDGSSNVAFVRADDLAVDDCSVELDDGSIIDPGIRLAWSEAIGNYIAFQPGGTKLFRVGALLGEVAVIPLQGCTILDAVDFAGEVVVLAAAGGGSGIQVGAFDGDSIVWHQTIGVPGLAFHWFIQAHMSHSRQVPPWRDRRVVVAGELLVVHCGSVVAASRNPLFGPWAVVDTIDLANVVGSDGSGRLLAIDRYGVLVNTPAIG
mgnify:FL=1